MLCFRNDTGEKYFKRFMYKSSMITAMKKMPKIALTTTTTTTTTTV